MRYLALLAAASLMAQAPPETDLQVAGRLIQLMESTAVAIPGLVQASDPLRRVAAGTLASMKAAPQDNALKYRFVKQTEAYIALAESFPRPDSFPPTAAQQFSELRGALTSFEQKFESGLNGALTSAQAKEADPSELKRYADANSKLPPPGVAPRVVFFGDSITDLWPLNEYFTGRDFVNRGISGQTTLEMIGRFIPDVAALKAKAVLILAGTNDLARGISVPAIENNLTLLGEISNAYGIKPLFASILPVSDYHKDNDPRYERTKTRPPSSINQINAWMKDYCGREGFTYVDYFSAMVDTSGNLKADLADDGLHPNPKGYRVMAPIALEDLNRTLVQPAPAEKKRRMGILGK